MEENELSIICSAETSIETKDRGGSKSAFVAVCDEREKFNALREQHSRMLEEHARALDRSLAALYALLAFVYWAWGELLENDAEFDRLREHEFFQCSRQKPDKENLCRQLLYFIADAQTEKERNRWSKPAKVLAHFRTEKVYHEDVARLLKERNGFVKICRSISAGGAECDGVNGDLDLLARVAVDPAAVASPGTAARSIALRVGAPDASQVPLEEEETAPENGNPDIEIAEHRDPDIVAASLGDSAEERFAHVRTNRLPVWPASVSEARKKHLFVKALDGKIARTLRCKYAAVFVKIGALNAEVDYTEVEALHIRPWDGTVPPDMISTRHGEHEEKKEGGVSPPAVDDETPRTGSPTSLVSPPEREPTPSTIAEPSREPEWTLPLADALTPAGAIGTGKPPPPIGLTKLAARARPPVVEILKSRSTRR